MLKSVSVQRLIREPGNPSNVTSAENANGWTEDEGQTIIIPLGYLPTIHEADPQDIVVTVNQPAVVNPVNTFVSRTDNETTGASTIVLS